jgi:tetratricopeptide (TPR) repeat protein
MNLVLNQNSESGIRSLKKALEIDSTFTLASFYIAYAYNYQFQFEPSIKWIEKTYLHKERVPPKYQLWIELWYACYFGRKIEDISKCCDQLAESGINTRFFWSDLGVTYTDFLHQYEKAVAASEKVLEINPERIGDWKFILFWDRFMMALHRTGKHEREREISYLVLKILPDQSNWPYYRMAICALSHGNTEEANEILVKYMAKHKELGTKESLLESFLGQMYEEANIMDQAEMHFRKAHIFYLAQFLINNDRNVDEGMELIHKLLEEDPKDEFALQLEGWGLYKQGKYEEALQLLGKMWEISKGFNTELYNHLEAAKKAVAKSGNM